MKKDFLTAIGDAVVFGSAVEAGDAITSVSNISVHIGDYNSEAETDFDSKNHGHCHAGKS